ncbi:PhoX family protein [Paracoccus jiaweipingae]|uniref:PhoX family protein n=1 Tax=unclassified Paracoccus (in: a-proteobacteria) TaxID=2688777 RepID=UPI0037992007
MQPKAILLAATALAALPLTGQAQELAFSPVPFAADDAAKRQVLASDKVTVDGKDYPIAYHVLARTGDKLGDGVFGALIDRDGKVVTSEDGSEHLSVDADFTSLIRKGDKLYAVTHFESRPGAIYVTELTQDGDGKLTATKTSPVDFAQQGGLWVPCAGSVTPWGNHLGGEEYPPNAEAVEAANDISEIDEYYRPMARFFGLDPATMTLDDFRAAFNPYAYGFPTEITIDDQGHASATKHYAMGRVAIELAHVMPDNKTVYITDDGTNVGLYKFIADQAGKLDAGTLYAAKWTQTADQDAGEADIDWVELGHATSDEVRKLIDAKTRFADIFEVADMAEDGSCADGFTPSIAEDVHQCLKVKPGMELAAATLETRRYAAIKGATLEFRKMEGFTWNPQKNEAYLAMSEVSKGMEDAGKQDLGGSNDIRLTQNKCGAVYALSMDDSFNVSKMRTLLTGKPVDDAVNSCDIDGIANPDNLTFIDGYDTLIIGEDTGDGHQNDAIWSYNLTSGALTRIFSTPYGSETTSPYWYPDVNGHGYLMAVVQHPYGESDEDKLQDAADARAYVGYIGPFPAMGGHSEYSPAQ